MTDLRDPKTRAEVCASCHLGNAREGKVVTHAMYAAGHPPLSAFETSRFLEAMPPHWWKSEDVPLFRVDPAARDRFVAPSNRVRDAIIGDLVTFRESMKLLADHASSRNWPEYSAFECYSCHHELQSPGYLKWRQARGNERTFGNASVLMAPGRPPLRAWPWAFSSLDREGSQALSTGMGNLFKAVDAVPFGDPVEIASAAREVSGILESQLRDFILTPPSRLDETRYRRLFSTSTEGNPLDFDSARQLAWMLRAYLGDDHPSTRPVMERLERLVKLDPFSSREHWSEVAGDLKRPESSRVASLIEISETEYRASLAAAAAFDPETFGALMKQLAERLPGGLPPAIPERR